MGGNAFTSEGLACPRLSHEQYCLLRDDCIAILEGTFYRKIISPPEAPSKIDHGDIDFLATGPIDNLTVKDVSAALGAVRNTKAGATTSYAVQHPKDDTSISTPEKRAQGKFVGSESFSTPKVRTYAQIDIHVCRPEDMEWTLFESSYGDLMQILGVMNRSIGLTANDRGLHIRLEQIEKTNRKNSLIYLTKDPRVVMKFLGLNASTYYAEAGSKGFQTNEDIFDWCAAGRFYTSPVRTPASEGGNETANDRQRYNKRSMFSTCMIDYYPAHPELFANRKEWTRQDVVKEALQYFPAAQPLHKEALREHVRAEYERQILQGIKDVIPVSDPKLGETMRGLKRFVRYEDGKPKICDDHKEEISNTLPWIREVNNEVKLQELLAWVKENWLFIRTLEANRMAAAKAARNAEKAVGKGKSTVEHEAEVAGKGKAREKADSVRPSEDAETQVRVESTRVSVTTTSEP